jgi:tripartite ATP-independent transporter DctM subunit
MRIDLVAALLGFLASFSIGVPIAFCLGISGISFLLLSGDAITVAVQKMYSSIDSFPLLALPLFVSIAHVMEHSGLLEDLIEFLISIFGRFRSGMAQVNIAASMLFAGLSGTAVSDAAGLGPAEMRMMEKAGYPKEFSAALTAASALIGPIIPPSIPIVLYAMSAGGAISIAGLFASALVPGIAIGLSQMVYSYFRSKRFPSLSYSHEKKSIREILQLFVRCLPALFLTLIIIGGILGGIFTVTEAAGVGLVYALAVGFFVTRKLTLRKIPLLAVQAAIVTGTLTALFGAGSLVAWLMTTQQLPVIISNYFTSVIHSPYIFMLTVLGLLLIVGCVLDTNSAIIMFVPLLTPLATSVYGIHPYTFGTLFVVALLTGLLTPPVGTLLFVMSSLAKLRIEELLREIWPFVIIYVLICLVKHSIILGRVVLV